MCVNVKNWGECRVEVIVETSHFSFRLVLAQREAGNSMTSGCPKAVPTLVIAVDVDEREY